MFKLYFPYSGQLETVRALDDDMLLGQLENAECVCQALVDAGDDSRMLCVRQWRGYEGFVLLHLRRLVTEIMLRGLHHWEHNDPRNPYVNRWIQLTRKGINQAPRPPRWIGGQWYLDSNRSELIRIYPTYYAQRFPTTPLDMPYVWPQNIPGSFDYTTLITLRDKEMVETGERVLPDKYFDHIMEKIS